MAFGFVSGGLLLLCAVTCALRDIKGMFQQSPGQPQVSTQVECKAQYLFISVDIPPSGSEPRFEAIDATGAYPVTGSYGVQCGYTYSAQPLLGRVILRASYFSCHTDNQNDGVFSFMFGVIITDQSGEETFFNISRTCSVPPFAPREVTCEENYMEVSVRTGLPCPSAGSVKGDFSALTQSSAVEPWQVILQQEGQQSNVMSTEDAATLGYFVMTMPSRLIFRTSYGQSFASVKMVNNVPVEVIQATVFFRQNWMMVTVDLVAACSLDAGSFDGYQLHWKTPAVMTPLGVGPSELRSEYIGMGVDGVVMDTPVAMDRGYSVMVGEDAIDSSIPYAAEGGFRKSFVMDNVYHEIYTVQLDYQQMSVDNSGMETKQNVVRQMSTPPIPHPPYSVNQTNPAERVFTVYLGNIPSDVQLVSVELNGQEISVMTAMQIGYSITRVSEDNSTFAYILRVPFEDQFVVKQYISQGLFQYLLEIKWTLNIMPQMDPYYHDSSVTALGVNSPPPVFDSMCADSGISFRKDHLNNDYLWDFAIGHYRLTPQLASERGYIMTNDSTALMLDVPLFTIGYTYENITLQQFYGTFEILTRSAKTLEIAESSARSCLFQTTELLVCSTEGVMTVVSDITKSIPTASPSRSTLLDLSCRPQETDESRVLFSFGLNTCGTRVQIDRQYVTYENEILFHELYSTDTKPVITRDAAYSTWHRQLASVTSAANELALHIFQEPSSTPAPTVSRSTTEVDREVHLPSKWLRNTYSGPEVQFRYTWNWTNSSVFKSLQPMQIQETLVKQPSFQAPAVQKPAGKKRVGQWPVDKRTQWSLGTHGNF